MSEWEVITGDCLDVMPTLPDLCADAIITDLPYGTTACSWDEVIPFAPMWAQVRRLLKPRGAFVTTASQPFTSKLVMSNTDWFRYVWVWEKTNAKGHLNVKTRPLMATEDICIFSANGHTYNPQGLIEGVFKNSRPAKARKTRGAAVYGLEREYGHSQYTNYPRNLLRVPNPNNNAIHPTQKPVALYEYLIRTYTNEGDTVLDFTCGSGTTGVACVQTGRNFIGVELREDYATIARKRIEAAAEQARQGELL